MWDSERALLKATPVFSSLAPNMLNKKKTAKIFHSQIFGNGQS